MSNEKADITYPCKWVYRVIGTDEQVMKNTASSIIQDKEYELKQSNQSSSGKYISLVLTIVVDSEEERVSIFNGLKSSNEIKMVL